MFRFKERPICGVIVASRSDHIVIPMKIFGRVDAQEQKDVLMLSAVSRYMVLHGESAPGCYTRYPNGEVQIHVRLFGGSSQYE